MKITVCVDVLGSEEGVSTTLEGCASALKNDPELSLLLAGPEDACKEFIEEYPERAACVPCTEYIAMDEHPATAVRTKKNSSIVLGCKAVKEGRADAFFSPGSTGACMTASTLIIGRIKGIDRPALAMPIPGAGSPTVLMDIGANADCKPEYLVQFAKMGTIYSQIVVGAKNPSVALLNIGEEETKGSAFAQETYALMKENLSNFAGNAEGRDIMASKYDVIVTDGFTGNIVLKTVEGTAKMISSEVKNLFLANIRSKVAAVSMHKLLRSFKKKFSVEEYGGAILLGTKKVTVIGHGSSTARAVQRGIEVAAKAAREDMPGRIAELV